MKQCFQNSNQKICLGRMFFERLLGVRGDSPGRALLVARSGPSHWNEIKPEKIFYIFYYFKLKKETRRKIINVSQLAFRNFRYVSGKHMNIPCFFIFVLFSMKAKTFPAHICRKKHFLFVKKTAFFLYNSLI